MQIINVDTRRFLVLETVNVEHFKSDQSRDEFFKGKVYLRQENSPTVYMVNEIEEAKFEDIPDPPTEVPPELETIEASGI